MTTFSHAGRVFEVQGVGPIDEPGFHYELWDLSQWGGMVGRIVVTDPGDPDGIQVELGKAVSADVLIWWMHSVPELRDRVALPPGG